MLRWIRQQTGLKNLRVVVITCSELEQDVSLACTLGANSFIVKPVDLDSLIRMVEASRSYWLGIDKPPHSSRPHNHAGRQESLTSAV